MNKKIVVSLTLVALLVPLLISVVPVNAWSYPDCTEDAQWEKFGPRADNIHILLHTDDIAEFTAFELGQFDVVDWPLPRSYIEKWSESPYVEKIKVLPYGAELGMDIIDLNNNPNYKRGCPPGYDSTGAELPPDEKNPVYPNPMGCASMRHAIAHCFDRAYIAAEIYEGYGVPMYTPVPPSMPNYVHPEIVPGGALEELTHPYSIEEAQIVLFGPQVPYCTNETYAKDTCINIENSAHVAVYSGVVRNVNTGNLVPLDENILYPTGTCLHVEATAKIHVQDPVVRFTFCMGDNDKFPVGEDGRRYWDMNGNCKKDLGPTPDDDETLKLKYYIRSDDALRRDMGLWHSLQIQSAKVDVEEFLLDSTGCWSPVMLEHNFHLYTGGWGLGVDPDHLVLYQMCTSIGYPEDCDGAGEPEPCNGGCPAYYWYPGFCYNYGAVNCTAFDAWVDALLEANTFDEAKYASYMAQEAMNDPGCVGVIPGICMKGYKAHARCYTGGTGGEPVSPDDGENQYRCQDWKGIINVPAYGCDQDFWNMYPEGHLVGDGEHMTVRYGFKVPDVKKLNVIYAEWMYDWNVLGRIYDSLLTRDDYTYAWIPQIAKDFEVGTWIDPIDKLEKSKVKITLRSDLYWHDGVPVSMADVLWTFIEEPERLPEVGLPPPWGSESFRYIKSFYMIDPCTVEMLLSVKSVWAVNWIGGYSIHPKHIWSPLIDSYEATDDPDLTGFSPDPDLIGCDAWRLVEYVSGSHIYMTKNQKCKSVTTNLHNELGPAREVHEPAEVYKECPVHANVHTLKEYNWTGGEENMSIVVSSQWHQIKGPEICTEWHIEKWLDNDDGVLSQCDKILLAKKPELEEKHWEHVYYYDPVNKTLWTDWYSQKVTPCSPVAFGVELHNQWLNPIPNTAESENTGYLIVNKYVYVTYPDGTVEYLVEDETVELPACLHHKEIFNLHFNKSAHSITVAAHIKGPETVWVTKDGGVIEVPNPWICTWQNYTWYFWSTIKEDIAGKYFDTWHGKNYIPPGGDVGYMVPTEVPCPDCRVTPYDLTLCAWSFGTYPGHKRWNSITDINGDYKSGGLDLTLIAKQLGWG